MHYSLHVGDRLLDLSTPAVMGILNITPDSFYAASRMQDDTAIAKRVHQILDEGGSIIDVGAYSSRPGALDVPEEEEMERLRHALHILRSEAPDAVISIDTFRSHVAKMCVEECGAHIINDISGGAMDKNMFRTVAKLHVPYILMHMQGTPSTMQVAPHYENLEQDIFRELSEKVDRLRTLGVNDIILDPGFGFGKTLAHNYELMACLEDFAEFGLPLLVGISRKSMIYKLLGGTPADALGGTIALHMVALMKGAHILRVHDVKAAVETVRIHCALQQPETL